MKKIITIAVVSMLFSIAKAQEYQTFCVDGRMWQMVDDPRELLHKARYFTYYLSGDTLFNGISCLKMYESGKRNRYEGAVYETDRKVFFCPAGRSDAVLLYDFGASKGEIVRSTWMEIKVIGDTLLNVESASVRALQVVDVNHEGNEVLWIEGVGCEKFGPLYPSGVVAEGNFDRLVCCMQGDRILYASPDIPSRITAVSKSTSSPLGLYDLLGRRVIGSPRPGIYIQQGRKRMVR